MPTACLPLYTPFSSLSSISKKTSIERALGMHATTPLKLHGNSVRCRAASSISDFDLYDLLGIDSSSDQSQIKLAYRSLQKRCHPDIAGSAGHDMAIILNDAYSILSDPNLRSVYDKALYKFLPELLCDSVMTLMGQEQAKVAELRGYTGKPLYSVWFGSENEERAVFVDEVKCVGCLKCALFAKNTFAIESVYGRARVVAQWADPEHQILQAIETCPVDCISMVGRSDLAALEFLMSKQPRGNVRVGMGNAAGARVSNIFVDVKKFQTRFSDEMEKASTERSKETDLQREARMSAIQAIRSISNWFYWQTPNSGGSTPSCDQKLTYAGSKSKQPNIDKLRDAAAARKQASSSIREKNRKPSHYMYHDDYWIPIALTLPASLQTNSSSTASSNASVIKDSKQQTAEPDFETNETQAHPMNWGIPMGIAIVAGAVVQSQAGEDKIGGLKEHIGGSFALEIVNSSGLQIILAAITWFVLGTAVVEIMGGIGKRKMF